MEKKKGMEKFVLTGKATETHSSIILNLLQHITEAHVRSSETDSDTIAQYLLTRTRRGRQRGVIRYLKPRPIPPGK